MVENDRSIDSINGLPDGILSINVIVINLLLFKGQINYGAYPRINSNCDRCSWVCIV